MYIQSLLRAKKFQSSKKMKTYVISVTLAR